MSQRTFTSPVGQKRDADIFSQKSRKAVISNTTAEGNRLAALIMKEKGKLHFKYIYITNIYFILLQLIKFLRSPTSSREPTARRTKQLIHSQIKALALIQVGWILKVLLTAKTQDTIITSLEEERMYLKIKTCTSKRLTPGEMTTGTRYAFTITRLPSQNSKRRLGKRNKIKQLKESF